MRGEYSGTYAWRCLDETLYFVCSLSSVNKGKEAIIALELHRILHLEWLSSFESFECNFKLSGLES